MSGAGSPAPAAPTTTGALGDVTLLITDLRFVNSEESDNAFRALVDSRVPDLTVTVTGVPTPK